MAWPCACPKLEAGPSRNAPSPNQGAPLLVFQLQSAVVAEIILESFAELRRCTTHFADPSGLATKLYPGGVLEFLRLVLGHTRWPPA